jgi:hypothetical protein
MSRFALRRGRLVLCIQIFRRKAVNVWAELPQAWVISGTDHIGLPEGIGARIGFVCH